MPSDTPLRILTGDAPAIHTEILQKDVVATLSRRQKPATEAVRKTIGLIAGEQNFRGTPYHISLYRMVGDDLCRWKALSPERKIAHVRSNLHKQLSDWMIEDVLRESVPAITARLRAENKGDWKKQWKAIASETCDYITDNFTPSVLAMTENYVAARIEAGKDGIPNCSDEVSLQIMRATGHGSDLPHADPGALRAVMAISDTEGTSVAGTRLWQPSAAIYTGALQNQSRKNIMAFQIKKGHENDFIDASAEDVVTLKGYMFDAFPRGTQGPLPKIGLDGTRVTAAIHNSPPLDPNKTQSRCFIRFTQNRRYPSPDLE